VQRGQTERKNRRVGLRPAPDTMSLLTGYLPAEQGVACLKALQQQTDAMKAAGDARCRDQIMADTLVERVTGQARASNVNAELQIVMDLDTLRMSTLRPSSWPATGRCRLAWPATFWPPARAGFGGDGSTPHRSVGHWREVIRTATASTATSEG